MFTLQSRLQQSSVNITKRSPCLFLFSKYCKKCSESVKAAEKGDVSEDVSNKDFGRRFRDREISLLGPVDARLPFPGNVGFSPLLIQSSLVKQIEKQEKLQFELTCEFNSGKHTKVFDVVLSELVEYFEYDFPDSENFRFVVNQCPQLLYNDVQLLSSSPILDSSATLVTLFRNKNDERNKEEVIQHFVSVSQKICKKLENLGFWAYSINPFDVKTMSNAASFEAVQRFRRYSFSVKPSNKCVLITHRKWGKDSFVGSLVTNAHFHSLELRSVLDEMTAKVKM